MEVDSGAACSVIDPRTMRRLGLTKKRLMSTEITLRTYSKRKLTVLGSIDVPVNFKGKEHKLPLLVVKGSGESLLGRNWFRPLGINIEGIHQLSASLPRMQELEKEFPN
ncbi:unnamed protein product, partial [Ixodes hexagonus]